MCTTYSFTLKPGAAAVAKAQPFGALRLVWHDYPGQWFAEVPGSAEVADRRVRTFKDLLSADVAVVLVDGQKLLDNAGEEERYLKSMLWSIKGGLEALKDGILVNGKKLSTFPRIWVLALSKADLHPGLNASRFEDLVIEKAAGDLNELQTTLRGFVSEPDALSLGEDYMLLSSARFEPGRIRVDERVGVDLIASVACTLPLEMAAQWVALGVNPKALEPLIKHMDGIAAALGGPVAAGAVKKVIGKVPKLGKLGEVLVGLAVPAFDQVLHLAKGKLQQAHDEALARHDLITAIVTQFRMDLEKGVEDQLMVKRP